MKFTIVTFDPLGDAIPKALYIDGELYKYGDYYHDKIDEWIDGFIEGVKYTKAEIDIEEVECNNDSYNEEIAEMGDSPDEVLDLNKLKDESSI